jgi:hypothetical protein
MLLFTCTSYSPMAIISISAGAYKERAMQKTEVKGNYCTPEKKNTFPLLILL